MAKRSPEYSTVSHWDGTLEPFWFYEQHLGPLLIENISRDPWWAAFSLHRQYERGLKTGASIAFGFVAMGEFARTRGHRV